MRRFVDLSHSRIQLTGAHAYFSFLRAQIKELSSEDFAFKLEYRNLFVDMIWTNKGTSI